jgi:hypothetical protein
MTSLCIQAQVDTQADDFVAFTRPLRKDKAKVGHRYVTDSAVLVQSS